MKKELLERYSRQIIIKDIGALGQKKISSSKIFVGILPKIAGTTGRFKSFTSTSSGSSAPSTSAAVVSSSSVFIGGVGESRSKLFRNRS